MHPGGMIFIQPLRLEDKRHLLFVQRRQRFDELLDGRHLIVLQVVQDVVARQIIRQGGARFTYGGWSPLR